MKSCACCVRLCAKRHPNSTATNPSPAALANSLKPAKPLCLSSLETAEYLEELIDLREGKMRGGILVRLIFTSPSPSLRR